MSQVETNISQAAPRLSSEGWRELWRKEDWWAIWLGLGIVLIELVLFAYGTGWRWIAVIPPKWTTFAQLSAHFSETWPRYVVQFVLWAAAFSVSLAAMGQKLREFLPAFV